MAFQQAFTGHVLPRTYLQLLDGASAPLSVTDTAIIRYNDATGNLELSMDGGPYVPIAGDTIVVNTIQVLEELRTSGRMRSDVLIQAGTISVTPNDTKHVIVCDTSILPATVELPPVASSAGRQLWIGDNGNASVNNITLSPDGAETIVGQEDFVISVDFGSVIVYCNGTQWLVF